MKRGLLIALLAALLCLIAAGGASAQTTWSGDYDCKVDNVLEKIQANDILANDFHVYNTRVQVTGDYETGVWAEYAVNWGTKHCSCQVKEVKQVGNWIELNVKHISTDEYKDDKCRWDAVSSYEWEDDRCTAMGVCTRNASHMTTIETVRGVYVKDSDATVESPETGHYEATFTTPGLETQKTETGSVTRGEPLPRPVKVWSGELNAEDMDVLQYDIFANDLYIHGWIRIDTDGEYSYSAGMFGNQPKQDWKVDWATKHNAFCVDEVERQEGDHLYLKGHFVSTDDYPVKDDECKWGLFYEWDGDQCTGYNGYCTRNHAHQSGNAVRKTVTGVYVKDTDATTEKPETGHYVATFDTPFKTQETPRGSVERGEPLKGKVWHGEHRYESIYNPDSGDPASGEIQPGDILANDFSITMSTARYRVDVICGDYEDAKWGATWRVADATKHHSIYVDSVTYRAYYDSNIIIKGHLISTDGYPVKDDECKWDDAVHFEWSRELDENEYYPYVDPIECTAHSSFCTRNPAHVNPDGAEETVTCAFKQDAPATCSCGITGHYEAAFKNPLFGTQKSVMIETGYTNPDAHKWGTFYEWNGDKCTGYYNYCLYNHAHKKSDAVTETVQAEYNASTYPDCTFPGTGHYWARFTKPQFEDQKSGEVTKGEPDLRYHIDGENEFIWDGDVCTRKCYCKYHTDTVKFESAQTGYYVQDTPATCTGAETGYYETLFLVGGGMKRVKSDPFTVGDPLGHSAKDGKYTKYNPIQHKFTCVRCGETVYEDHEWEPDESQSEDHETHMHCAKCGETKTTDSAEGFIIEDDTVLLKAGKNGKLEMKVGEEYAFATEYGLTIADGQTWKSSKAKVLSITADGAAKALKAGKSTVKIKVLAPNAKGKLKKKTASIIVNVIDPSALRSVKIVPISPIRLGRDIVMQAKVDATEPCVLTWKSSKPKIAEIDAVSGRLTPRMPGKTKITVTAKQGKLKKTASFTVEVTAPLADVEPAQPKEEAE